MDAAGRGLTATALTGGVRLATIYILGSADPAYRHRLAQALRKRGSKVVELAGTAELSSRRLQSEPDFLILEIDDFEPNEAFVDVSLGRGSDDRPPPIIVLGRVDDPRAAESWRRRGALDFVSKTEPLDHVLGRLERILTRADRDHDFEELLSGLEAAEVEPDEAPGVEAVDEAPGVEAVVEAPGVEPDEVPGVEAIDEVLDVGAIDRGPAAVENASSASDATSRDDPELLALAALFEDLEERHEAVPDADSGRGGGASPRNPKPLASSRARLPGAPVASGAPVPSRREEAPIRENRWRERMPRVSLGVLAVVVAAALVVFLGPVDHREGQILSRAPAAIATRASPPREETVGLPRPPLPARTTDATPALPEPADDAADIPASAVAEPPDTAGPAATPAANADPMGAVPQPSPGTAETPPSVRGVRRARATRLLIDRAGALSFVVPWKDQDLVGGGGAVGVTFSVLVDPGGLVEDVQVLGSSGNPTLDRMAAEALREASYRPALRQGAPVPARIVQTMTIRRY